MGNKDKFLDVLSAAYSDKKFDSPKIKEQIYVTAKAIDNDTDQVATELTVLNEMLSIYVIRTDGNVSPSVEKLIKLVRVVPVQLGEYMGGFFANSWTDKEE